MLRSRSFARALVALVVSVSALTLHPAAADPPSAWFEGNLAFNNAAGCGFAPNTMLGILVNDQNGTPIYEEPTPPTDPSGCFNIGFPFPLAEAMTITVNDGLVSKVLVLEHLSIDGIDPASNMIWGSAPPNRTFHVDADRSGNGTDWVSLPPVTADPTGNWDGNFNEVGFDLLPNTHVGANIQDPDGDNTAFDLQMGPPPPPGPQPQYTDPNAFRNATAGLGAPTVIDFEDIDAPPGNSIDDRPPFDGNHYADLGVTFSNPNGVNLYIAPGGLAMCGGFPNPQPCEPWNESNSLSVGEFPNPDHVSDDNDDDLVITLDPPAAAVGFTLVDNGGQGPDETIRFVDAGGAVIDEPGLPGPYGDPFRSFAGMVSTNRPISEIHISENANDGDDVNYDDIIVVPPPVPDLTPSITVSNESLKTDYGSTPAHVGWARAINVEVSNIGGIAGEGSLDVWVRSETDGTETHIGSVNVNVAAHRSKNYAFNWNGFGMAGEVKVYARTCSDKDRNDGNDVEWMRHYVLVGGTGFGYTGPQTQGGDGDRLCS